MNKDAIIGDDKLTIEQLEANKTESKNAGSQILCKNCKGACQVVVEDGSKEICLVCEGTGIQPEEKDE